VGTGVYQVELTDINGTVLTDLSAKTDSTSVVNIVEELNEPGSCELTMHTVTDPKTAQVAPYVWRRFIRITKAGLTRFWGPITRSDAKGEVTTIQCQGMLAALRRRFFGPEPSVTQFGYPTVFAADGTPSAPTPVDFPVMNGTENSVGGRWSQSATLRSEGVYSLKGLRLPGDTNGYYEYSFDFTGGGGAGELLVFFRAWYHIVSKVAAGYNDVGLRILIYDVAGDGSLSLNGSAHDWKITESTPMGKWFPMEMAIFVPATHIRIITQFYSPGEIYWDRANYFQENFVGTGGTPEDLSQIVRRIAEYGISGYDKSPLNMAVSIPDCGITDDRNYSLSSNENIGDALAAYVTSGYYDFAVVPGATSWTFTGYASTKGSFKPNLAIDLDRRNIVEAPTFALDGDQVTTKPRVLGAGSGPNRTISEVIDTTSLDGMILESVETAPSDAPTDSLDKQAKESLRRGKAGVDVSEVTLKILPEFDPIAEGLTVGDTFPLTVSYGWVNLTNVTKRAIKITELPNDLVKLTLNTP